MKLKIYPIAILATLLLAVALVTQPSSAMGNRKPVNPEYAYFNLNGQVVKLPTKASIAPSNGYNNLFFDFTSCTAVTPCAATYIQVQRFDKIAPPGTPETQSRIMRLTVPITKEKEKIKFGRAIPEGLDYKKLPYKKPFYRFDRKHFGFTAISDNSLKLPNGEKLLLACSSEDNCSFWYDCKGVAHSINMIASGYNTVLGIDWQKLIDVMIPFWESLHVSQSSSDTK